MKRFQELFFNSTNMFLVIEFKVHSPDDGMLRLNNHTKRHK